MITVSYCNASIECSTAIKGDTFIRLLDEHNHLVASFDGISDFSSFIITGGTWTAAESINDCYLVVMKRDGTLARSSKKFGDL